MFVYYCLKSANIILKRKSGLEYPENIKICEIYYKSETYLKG